MCNRHWLQIKRNGKPTDANKIIPSHIQHLTNCCSICGDRESIKYYIWHRDGEYKNKEQTQRMPKLIFLANAIDCLFPYVKKIEEEKEIKNVKYISELMHNLFAFLWNDDKDLFYYNIEILNNIFNKKEDYLTQL